MNGSLRAFVEYQRLRNLRPGTIARRTQLLTRLASWLDPIPLTGATAGDLDGWLESCSLSPACRNSYIATLHAFYDWARESGLVERDPTRKLVRAKTPRRLPRPAATADFERAVQSAPPMVRAWLLLAGLAGLRCHEIARLRRQDVRDQDDPAVLFVADGKGGHQREIPLHPDLVAALRPFLHKGWLFTNRDGNRYHSGTVSSYIARHFRRHGMDVSAHELRHWFGTNVYRNTKDLRATQELLGHSDPKTTTIYTLIDSASRSGAVASLDWRTVDTSTENP